MFEVVKDIWQFFTNREHPWTAKASISGVIVMALVFCELTTGLVSGFINSQRIGQLTEIENALINPGYDSTTITYLRSARRGIVERGPFPSYSLLGIVNQLRDAWSLPVKYLNGSRVDPVLLAIITVISTSGFFIFGFIAILSTTIRGVIDRRRRRKVFVLGQGKKLSAMLIMAVISYLVIVSLSASLRSFLSFSAANLLCQATFVFTIIFLSSDETQ